MNFTEFSFFNESLQNPKMVLLREALPIWQTNKLSVLVIPNGFQLLPLGRYLLPVTTLNRYQPSNSNVM